LKIRLLSIFPILKYNSGIDMKTFKAKIAFLFFGCFIIFSSCQSLKKDIYSKSADEKTYRALAEVEETLIRLDGAGASGKDIAGARQMISGLDGSATDNNFQALLAAWSGRLYLMEGKSTEAQREYRKSESLAPRNLQAQILFSRMERNTQQRLQAIDSSLETEGLFGELLIERGRVLFDLNRFSESVAAFDRAFLLLAEKNFYEETYLVFRSKAWELRELEMAQGGRTTVIARQEEISWKDLIEITQTESDLLRFITAGRTWPSETIFTQLLDRSFIPITQDTDKTTWPYSKPSSGEIVLRSGAAWFLWHLHAENRANRGLLTRYSSRLLNTANAKSPIPDLSISSPFLDSILGCVESEFISLPDGRNFLPANRVKGHEYLTMLKKL
jgi:tetratricopeptide (TPR) repeat protein